MYKKMLFCLATVIMSNNLIYSSEDPKDNSRPYQPATIIGMSAFAGAGLATTLFSPRAIPEKFCIAIASGLAGSLFGFGVKQVARVTSRRIPISEELKYKSQGIKDSFRLGHLYGMVRGINFSWGTAAFAIDFSAVLFDSSRK